MNDRTICDPQRIEQFLEQTKTGVIAGAPQYMSPEQARGEPVDQRSDLFSLGSVLYAMCTGRPPFRAETSYGVLRRITDEEPRPIREINPDIPDWLCGIVGKLMSKRPDGRFSSAQEVAALLEQCLAHVQQPTIVPLPKVAGTGYPRAGGVPSASGSLFFPGEGQGVRAAAHSHKSRNIFTKGTLTMLTLIGISLFAVGVVSTNPPDISGRWQGDGWGQVTLKQGAPGEYTGTYTDTVAKEKQPGKLTLKWSRIERRFNGTWREGDDDRFGDLSVRLVDNAIRGALTTSDKSKINPATPRLADLVWTQAKAVQKITDVAPARTGSAVRKVLAFSQDSNRSYVMVPGSPSLHTLTDGRNKQLSLTAWVYPTEEMDNNGVLYKGRLDRSQGVFQVSFAHGVGQPNKLNFRLNGAGLGDDGELTSDEHIPLNQWTFIACTYDGDKQRIYINGALAASAAYHMPLQEDASAFFIGIYQSTTYRYNDEHYQCFQGSIADVGLWKKGLDNTAIAALYEAGRGGLRRASRALRDNRLTAGYALDEGRGTTVADFSGHENTGKLQSDVPWGLIATDKENPSATVHSPRAEE
jgi:hypothetical protein